MGEIADKAERAALIVLITMIAVIVFLGIVVRYTPITVRIIWTAELARLFLLWAAFWAAGSIERVSGHFRIDIFEELVKGKPLLLVQVFIKLVLLVTMGIVIWWTIAYCELVWGVPTLILGWPEIIRAVPFLLGSLLIFTYCLIAFIRILRRLFEQC